MTAKKVKGRTLVIKGPRKSKYRVLGKGFRKKVRLRKTRKVLKRLRPGKYRVKAITKRVKPRKRIVRVRAAKGARARFRKVPRAVPPGTPTNPGSPPAPPARPPAPAVPPPSTTPPPQAEPPLDEALRTGDPGALAPSALLGAAEESLTSETARMRRIHTDLFDLQSDGSARADGSSLTSISWDPSHDSAILRGNEDTNTAVLRTEGDGPIAFAGVKGSRFLVFGGNPMRNAYPNTQGYVSGALNLQMQEFLDNSFEWLIGRSDLTSNGFSAVIAHMDSRGYFADEEATRWWLSTRYGNVSYNAADSCDDDALKTCLDGDPDVLIISQYKAADPGTVAATVRSAMARGVPVMYVHWDGGLEPLGEKLLPLFDVGYGRDNYDWDLDVKGFDITSHPGIASEQVSVQRLLRNLRTGSWDVDLSQCVELNCNDVGLAKEFSIAADVYLRGRLTAWDEQGVDLFGSQERRLAKVLVLLGDTYRRAIRYPLDHTRNLRSWMNAYFADHAVYNNRPVNPAQTDLGDFSRPIRSAPTFTETGTYDAREFSHYTAAGFYALPGRTFTVERTDGSDLDVEVAINTERPESTHEFAPATDGLNNYDRPKYLRTPWMTLEKGRELTLTNPYGGPLQIRIAGTGVGGGPQAVEVRFSTVGKHPVWRGPADTPAFMEGLRSGPYNWAEVILPNFQLHSRKDYMLYETLSTEEHRTPDALADVTTTYWWESMYNLAGFSAPGLQLDPSVAKICTDNGWECTDRRIHGLGQEGFNHEVRHFTADKAVAGGGTPLEAYWGFRPLSWGDGHEAGHLLQRDLLKVYGGQSGEVSNNIFPLRNMYLWNRDHPDTPRHTENEPDQAKVFGILRDAQSAASPADAVRRSIWYSDDDDRFFNRLLFYYQLRHQAHALSQFGGDGWNLYTALYVHERLFSKALSGPDDWAAARASLGFDDYTHDEARTIGGNDYMLIATSLLTGRDQRPFWDLWGIEYSARAGGVVDVMRLPAAKKEFHFTPTDARGRYYNSLDPVKTVPVTKNAQVPSTTLP